MASPAAPASPTKRGTAVLAILGALGIGAFVIGRAVDEFAASLVLTGVWFALVAGAGVVALRRTPGLRVPVLATLAACAAGGTFLFYWTTVRDRTVNETVATGVKAAVQSSAPGVNVERASGSFAGLAHATSGTAAVVELAQGGRVLTLTDLRTDNGPDVRVYVVPGGSNPDGKVDGGIDLGALKGNIGTQQYRLPPGVRLDGGASVVLWCRAFTVAFGVAQLRAA